MSQMPYTGPPGMNPMTMGQNRPRPTPQYDQGRGTPMMRSGGGSSGGGGMMGGGIGPSFGGMNSTQMNRGPAFFKQSPQQNPMNNRSMDRFGQPQQRGGGGMFGGIGRAVGGMMSPWMGGNGMNSGMMRNSWMQPPMMNSGGQMGNQNPWMTPGGSFNSGSNWQMPQSGMNQGGGMSPSPDFMKLFQPQPGQAMTQGGSMNDPRWTNGTWGGPR